MGAIRLRKHVEDICSVSTFIDPDEWDVDHLTGKLEDYLAYSRKRLDVVVEKFVELGYEPEFHDFTYYGRPARNAIFSAGKPHGSGLWLAAHHDYCAGLGAEDDATGLAVMLELARQFRDSPAAEHLVFASFDLEERGMVGASRYASSLTDQELGGIDALITLECLGSGKDFTVCESLEEREWECDKELNKRLIACAGSLGYPLLSDRYEFGSDAIPFSNRGVRATDLCSITYSAYKAYREGTGNWDDVTVTHTSRDMPENIDYFHLADAGRLLAAFIRREYCR